MRCKRWLLQTCRNTRLGLRVFASQPSPSYAAAPNALMPQLPMSFLDHAQFDRHLMQAKRLEDLQWWCNQLAGASLEPLLKTDFPRSGRVNIGQNQGDIVRVSHRPYLKYILSKGPWQQLLCVCQCPCVSV